MPTRPLEGKTALVTGGSRGVGAGIVARLAADGATVAFTYARSAARADAVAAAAVAAGGTAHPICADSMHEEDVATAVTQSVDRFGGLDILVNNAAVGFFAPITDLRMDQIDAMLTVNVRSAIVAIRESLPHLAEGGRIINIGSINADRTPFPDQSIYALTKGALASLTRGLARELAPRGITINNIQPGPIDTDANPADGPVAPAMLGVMATERYGTAAEIGAFVSYLAGPDADYITGSSLNIDGGFAA
ncbi:3-oxoacyl-[acyl-carrier protein] reductase [Prauserella shujinwangii]|uniref:3-oxoacyl-[acyl-carrier protein] reductase n=1 Tax=Prauserella shujinwangii TaxID=1453103 RepID=A0A2T0LTK7_9PSEU|nr:SDR family oxidoreductase [Prauserella shujinwangii]PRX47055.1 3-oxoacyl-[acyl-carrier protein] reductase [Prauserella shujinwangii]